MSGRNCQQGFSHVALRAVVAAEIAEKVSSVEDRKTPPARIHSTFQDTNVAQWELVRLITREHRNVLVVGDADQSVYKFRGADHRNLMRFEEEFPDNKELEPIRKGLREQAKSLFDQARELVKDDKKSQALLLLRKAAGFKIPLHP